MPDRRRISKLLSLILRHRPDEFGLTMDEYGFIPLDEVVEAVQKRYSAVAEEEIRTLVESSRQRRFEIADSRIRALYAHSFFVEMDGEPIEPPESLYMIATVEAAATMKEDGIRPEDRFYLHLSPNRESAESRSGSVDNPALVEIRAAAAAAADAKFWARGEVVLTRTIEAEFVGEIVEVVGAPPPRRDEGDEDAPRRPRGRGDRDGGRRSEGGGRRERSEHSGGGESSASNSETTRRVEPKPEEMTFGRSAKIQAGSRR